AETLAARLADLVALRVLSRLADGEDPAAALAEARWYALVPAARRTALLAAVSRRTASLREIVEGCRAALPRAARGGHCRGGAQHGRDACAARALDEPVHGRAQPRAAAGERRMRSARWGAGERRPRPETARRWRERDWTITAAAATG